MGIAVQLHLESEHVAYVFISTRKHYQVSDLKSDILIKVSGKYVDLLR